jgi:LmbE family N-acetylglucosaminyl deacetylase
MQVVAVIAPHPDDEVLGCGGTIARLAAQGSRVHVVTVTRGEPPDFDPVAVQQVREEADAAHRRLGVCESHFLDLPAARLDMVGQAAVNARLGGLLDRVAPDTLFVPFFGDIHHDHQIAFTAAMVWARPRHAASPAQVFAYETLSETNWFAPPATPLFTPTVFIDIAATLNAKLAAFACYRSQGKTFPDERSPEAIRALAQLRGATVHRQAAEAFAAIRIVL